MLPRPTAAPIVANVKPVGLDQKSCGLLIAGLFGKRRTKLLESALQEVFA